MSTGTSGHCQRPWPKIWGHAPEMGRCGAMSVSCWCPWVVWPHRGGLKQPVWDCPGVLCELPRHIDSVANLPIKLWSSRCCGNCPKLVKTFPTTGAQVSNSHWCNFFIGSWTLPNLKHLHQRTGSSYCLKVYQYFQPLICPIDCQRTNLLLKGKGSNILSF